MGHGSFKNDNALMQSSWQVLLLASSSLYYSTQGTHTMLMAGLLEAPFSVLKEAASKNALEE
jgi:hypothetical protein